MKTLVKQLLSESAIYGISNMLSRFISIFLVPLYTKLLLPKDYGQLSLVNSTYYFVTVLAVFAMDSASARWYYDTDQESERKSVMASWFWFQLSLSILLCLIMMALSGVFSLHILHEDNRYLLFMVPAVGLISAILPNMVTNWLRFQRKAIHTVIFTVSNVLLTIGLNLLFVVYLRMNILGVLLATLIANTCATLYVIYLMKRWLALSYFSFNKLKEMLHYALPLVPTAFAFWILNSSSTFVINHFHNQTEVGLFQIANMLASAVVMVAGAFQMAWGPFAFSIIDKPEAKKVYAMVLSGYSAIMCTVAVAVAVFAREILIIFTNENYYDAAITAGVLCFNGIIYGYAYIAVMGCNVKKDNKPLAYSILAAALITAIMYLILVPSFGKIGAALSMVLGYVLVPIYLFYKSQQYWYIPFNFKTSIAIFVSAVLFFLLSLTIHERVFWKALLWKSGYLVLYLLLLIAILYQAYQKEFADWRSQPRSS